MRMNLSTRILLSFIGVFVAAVAILTRISYIRSRDALKDTMGNRLARISQEVLASTAQTLESFEKSLQSLEVLPGIKEQILVDDADGVISQALSQIARGAKSIGNVDFVTPGGQVIASTEGSRLKSSVPPGELEQARFSGLAKDAIPVPVGDKDVMGLRLILPVRVRGDEESAPPDVVGYIIGYLDWSHVTKILDDIREQERASGNLTTGILLISGARDIISSSPRRLMEDEAHLDPAPDSPDRGNVPVWVSRVDGGAEALVAHAGARSSGTPTSWSCRVQQATSEAYAHTTNLLSESLMVASLVTLILGTLGSIGLRRLVNPIQTFAQFATRVGSGELDQELNVTGTGDLKVLGGALEEMRKRIARARDDLEKTVRERTREAESRAEKLEEQDWLKSNINRLFQDLQGMEDLGLATQKALDILVPEVGGSVGLFYLQASLRDENEEADLYIPSAGYAVNPESEGLKSFRTGEGLVGQAIREAKKLVVDTLPAGHSRIVSGLGSSVPSWLLIAPVLHEGACLGAIEVGSLKGLGTRQLQLIDAACQQLGILLENLASRTRMSSLLARTSLLARELQHQQDELKASNEALERNAQLLSDERARVQERNFELQQAKEILENQASKLADGSRYKSEFLANMSHELRTPLNSIMMLADLMSENDGGNLTAEQVNWARSIHSSGRDLLELISDILDLSKIEAGKMEVHLEQASIEAIVESLQSTFLPISQKRGLAFLVDQDDSVPGIFMTDEKRVRQILKNLLSNAFKFTEKGSVTLRIRVELQSPSRDRRAPPVTCLVCEVTDTGIGIPQEKQALLFQPFTQADGSTSRKFGGTGLGMSISQQFATLLGGCVTLKSTEGVGSTFSLFLPLRGEADTSITSPSAPEPVTVVPTTARSGPRISPMKLAMVVDDDSITRTVLAGKLSQIGFEVVTAGTASEGCRQAIQCRPCAVVLDIRLPDSSGWSLLEDLRRLPFFESVPIHVLSAEDDTMRSHRAGATSHHTKPLMEPVLGQLMASLTTAENRRPKRILLIEDDDRMRRDLTEQLSSDLLEVHAVSRGEEAMAFLTRSRYDLLIVDIRLPGMDGLTLIRSVRSGLGSGAPAILLHTAAELPASTRAELEEWRACLVLKDSTSTSQVVNLVRMAFDPAAAAPAAKLAENKPGGRGKTLLTGRTILVVDDDSRNIEAMRARICRSGAEVLTAENGAIALEKLRLSGSPGTKSIDLVLLDLMMPVMDGYQTIAAIRADPRLVSMPVIILTAKAMPGDQERCLEAGADDYLSKPVDIDALFSKMTSLLDSQGPRA